MSKQIVWNPEAEMLAFPGVYRDTWEEALEVALNRKRQGSHQVIRIMKSTLTGRRTRFMIRPWNGKGERATRIYVEALKDGHDEQDARIRAQVGSKGGWY